jgi:hypothetical protein
VLDVPGATGEYYRCLNSVYVLIVHVLLCCNRLPGTCQVFQYKTKGAAISLKPQRNADGCGEFLLVRVIEAMQGAKHAPGREGYLTNNLQMVDMDNVKGALQLISEHDAAQNMLPPIASCSPKSKANCSPELLHPNHFAAQGKMQGRALVATHNTCCNT